MFEVTDGSLSWPKRLSGTSLRLSGLGRSQSLQQKPKAHDQLKQGHRRIEDVVVNSFVELREDEKNESAEHAPGRRDYTEDRQSFRDIVRFQPQPGTNGGGQSEERQAHI